MTSRSELLDRWRDDLAGWAIPERITSAVSESPWVLPRQVFARRSDRVIRAPEGPSYERALEALDGGGTVLDVGAGAGAASLPLAPRTTALTAVDTDTAMLGLLAERGTGLRLDVRTVAGRWPDVAPRLAPADVVTCHHVIYNVPDIEPFLAALTSHARRRVVVGDNRRSPDDVTQPAVAALPRSPTAGRADGGRPSGNRGHDWSGGEAH